MPSVIPSVNIPLSNLTPAGTQANPLPLTTLPSSRPTTTGPTVNTNSASNTQTTLQPVNFTSLHSVTACITWQNTKKTLAILSKICLVVLGLIVAWMTFSLTSWTSAKDWKLYCDEQKGNLNIEPSCAEASSRDLEPPPWVWAWLRKNSTDHAKRSVPSSTHFSRVSKFYLALEALVSTLLLAPAIAALVLRLIRVRRRPESSLLDIIASETLGQGDSSFNETHILREVHGHDVSNPAPWCWVPSPLARQQALAATIDFRTTWVKWCGWKQLQLSTKTAGEHEWEPCDRSAVNRGRQLKTMLKDALLNEPDLDPTFIAWPDGSPSNTGATNSSMLMDHDCDLAGVGLVMLGSEFGQQPQVDVLEDLNHCMALYPCETVLWSWRIRTCLAYEPIIPRWERWGLTYAFAGQDSPFADDDCWETFTQILLQRSQSSLFPARPPNSEVLTARRSYEVLPGRSIDSVDSATYELCTPSPYEVTPAPYDDIVKANETVIGPSTPGLTSSHIVTVTQQEHKASSTRHPPASFVPEKPSVEAMSSGRPQEISSKSKNSSRSSESEESDIEWGSDMWKPHTSASIMTLYERCMSVPTSILDQIQ